MTPEKPTALRQTITPYIGQTVIFSGVTIFSFVVAITKRQWGLLWAPGLIWPSFGLLVLFGLKYRVLWDETGVIMRASGGPERHIRFDEITRINCEVAISQSRPFRRIVIHGHKNDPNAFIDVSLRHFQPEDIKELLTVIEEHRPDLEIPPIPRIRETPRSSPRSG